ncbi:(2Fe-2S)-binding protein [Magnetovibrio blakemorei]|uniref:(2Fe-2S)-binding protein n=1 Tax=Magnetovibrio blakemorei TaxID=28181 RepID=UPI0009FEDC4F
MYICLCRGISNHDVRDAVKDGAQTAKCVFKSCGKKPKCGKCIMYLSDCISQQSSEPLSRDLSLSRVTL